MKKTFLILLIIGQVAFAQNKIIKDSTKTQELNEVVVSATQTRKYGDTITSVSLRLNAPLIEIPQNISIVTQQSIKDFGANGISDLLHLTSGVVKSYGGANDFAFYIRGTDATNNNFRDGVGGYWWNQQSDAFMIEQVEFVKGPAGFMIGNAEPGGIINEVSKQADGKRVREVELGYGSWNLMRAGIDIGDKFSKKSNFSYRLVIGGQKTNANYDFYQSHRTYIMPSLRYSYGNGSNVQIEMTKMNGFFNANSSGNISFNGTDYLYPAHFNAVDPNAVKGVYNEDNYIRISNIHHFKNGWDLKTQIADARGRYQGDQMYAGGYSKAFDTVFREYSNSNWRNYLQAAQSFVDGKFKTGSKIEHSFLTGIDYGNSYVKVTGGSYDPDNYGTHFPLAVKNPQYNLTPADVANLTEFPESKWGTKWLAWYGQDHIKFFKKVILTVAGRYSYTKAYTNWDSTTVSNKKFTPRLGLTYLINKNMSVYALYDETFLPQTGRKEDMTLPKPLTGSNTEIGYKAQLFSNRFFINSSLWHTVKNNVLVQNPLTSFYEERGQITSQGFEIAMVGNISKNVIINANYTYTDAKITKDVAPENIGFRNYGVAKNAGNAMVIYRFSKGKLVGLSIGQGVQFMGDRNVAYPGYTLQEDKDKVAAGYTLFDSNIGYEIKKFSIHLNLFNLLNKKYMASPWWNSATEDPVAPGYFSFNPSEPTNFRLSVGYKF